MREHLWRRNESWAALSSEARQQTRLQALETLVNARLIRSFRTLDDPKTPPSATTSAKREAEMQQRQFVDPTDFSNRLAAQQLTPKTIAADINASLLDEAWITQQIRPRLKSITQQDLHAWYDQHKESLRIPPAFHAAHIFLTRHDSARPDRAAEIRQIHRQLLAKEKTFAQLAAQYSEDDRTKSLGGDLGWFTRQRMPADFIAAVEHLKIGQSSEPVQTKLGWHLIILMERRDSRLPTFEEAQSEIAALLTTQRREAAVQQLLSDLRQRSQQPPLSVFYHAEVIDRTEPAP
jgi:hypothetical protein